MKTLTVSRSTARFIKLGHPWVRIDKFTKGLAALKTGDVVTLIDEHKRGIASALADPEQDICARVFHKLPQKHLHIHDALDRAKLRRQELIDDADTNCFRLIHGESDFLPGLRIEQMGTYLVILLRAPCIKVYLDQILTWCQKQFPQAQLAIKEQMDDLRRNPLRSYDAHRQALINDTEIIAKERGVQVICQPCDDLATGVYVDQRATRDFLRSRCQGKDIANAFAYTGLFSSALLRAGAASAVDIDISAPALALAERNAQLNEVADKHEISVSDSIVYFKNCGRSFDIIILDPPTAAHGKNKNAWVLRRDYPHLLKAALACLRPNGLIVACCNTLGSKKQFKLRSHIEEMHSQLSILENPAIGADIPSLKGFPESRPYELVIAKKP